MVNEVLFHAILGFQILDTEMCSRLSRFAISESNIYIYIYISYHNRMG